MIRRALLIAALLALPSRSVAADIPTPEAHFGFRMGADGRLATAERIEEYFALVAAASDRVALVDLGTTTDGHETIAAIISAPENIRNLDRLREANQRLADPRSLSAAEAQRIIATQKAVVAIGCSMHATEIGATQAASDLLYHLATASDPATLETLDNLVVVLIPMLNPDGHRLVVDWYDRQKGTRYDGGPMPWLDHTYAGHDINRDGFMMNTAENRNLSRFFYTEWHPQVFLSMHQMPSADTRFLVPPGAEPIDPNDDPALWREAAQLGAAMSAELERDHHVGVAPNTIYDDDFPGYEDAVPLGHNTVGLLTEAANARVASPVTRSPSVTWTLGDIVDYDLSAMRGLLRGAAASREQLVRTFFELGVRAVEAGRNRAPVAFVIPPGQHDPSATRKLEDLLLGAGVEIHRALGPFRADGESFPAGSDLILLAQPYRAYVKTLLERQAYPVGTTANGTVPMRPIDATGWTLPLQMGVDVRTIAQRFDEPAMSRVTVATIAPGPWRDDPGAGYYVIDGRGTGGALAANRLLAAGLQPSWLTSALDLDGATYPPGALVVPIAKTAAPVVARLAGQLGLRAEGARGLPPPDLRRLSPVRVGLYKPWLANIDEGWTRWLLEQYEFPHSSIDNAVIRSGNLRTRFDAIILPSAPGYEMAGGSAADLVPEEYAGGLGVDGLLALKAFVEAGGTLICLDRAGEFAIAAFDLPLRDVVRAAAGGTFFCPGSLLRVELDPSNPLSYGMEQQTAGFFSSSSAYETEGQPSGLRTAARYARKDLLLSGVLDGESVIAGRDAVVEAAIGAGRVVLLGFPVQHRGQSLATFRLLFNAIFTSSL